MYAFWVQVCAILVAMHVSAHCTVNNILLVNRTVWVIQPLDVSSPLRALWLSLLGTHAVFISDFNCEHSTLPTPCFCCLIS